MKTKILIIIVASNIFFIAGLLTGYCLYPRINYGSFDSSDALCKDTTLGMEESMDYLTENEVKAFLKEVRETLGEKNVTFDQIIDLKIKYDEHSFEYLQQDQDSSVYKKLNDYADLVNAIQTNNIEEAKRIAARHSIPKSHAELVRMLEERQDYRELKRFADIKKTVTTHQTGAGQSGKRTSAKEKKLFTCDKCGPCMYFNSKQELDTHKRKHEFRR